MLAIGLFVSTSRVRGIKHWVKSKMQNDADYQAEFQIFSQRIICVMCGNSTATTRSVLETTAAARPSFCWTCEEALPQ